MCMQVYLCLYILYEYISVIVYASIFVFIQVFIGIGMNLENGLNQSLCELYIKKKNKEPHPGF